MKYGYEDDFPTAHDALRDARARAEGDRFLIYLIDMALNHTIDAPLPDDPVDPQIRQLAADLATLSE